MMLANSLLTSSLLAAVPNLRHAFFTREGGVSEGIYASLNGGIGSRDDADHVRENRARMASAMNVAPDNFLTAYQVHSPDVAVAETAWDSTTRPHADAIVTRTPDLAIGITTADCGPVLFADPKAGVIGAAHAGWKGALTGVLENTIAAMERLGARRDRILASLGPSIGRQNYEVGPEFVDRFLAADAGHARFFTPSQKPGHALFDLPGLTTERLGRAGVTAENLDICTYPDEERFFSYRRTTHRQEPDYGRQISAIMIRA